MDQSTDRHVMFDGNEDTRRLVLEPQQLFFLILHDFTVCLQKQLHEKPPEKMVRSFTEMILVIKLVKRVM